MTAGEVSSMEMEWRAMDVSIHGTLTSPGINECRALAVFVAGSGPTDRDWCSPLLPGSNGSARLLAEELALRGIASLRYDKMASGPHVMENIPRFTGKISMQSHLAELRGAVNALASEMGQDGRPMLALTNSEGAIHAVNYQLQAEGNRRFSGLILTGVPGRTVGDVARSQLLAQGKSLPGIENMMKFYDEAIARFTSGESVEPDPSLPEGVRTLLRALENPNNLPFSRELWSYSLPAHLSGLTEPLLVLIGKKDIQIDWNIDGKALEAAMSGSGNASFAYPDNANHVLKHEPLPLEELNALYVSEHYNADDSKLDEGALNSITGWIDSRFPA